MRRFWESIESIRNDYLFRPKGVHKEICSYWSHLCFERCKWLFKKIIFKCFNKKVGFIL